MTGRTSADDLVSPAWLAERIDDPDVVIVDLRWREDGSGRERYRAAHIPNAVFCDWATDLVDPDHPVAFMLAAPDRFASCMSGLGIGDDTTVVAYADERGSGPFRLWWACRVYGHPQVRVLDGGLERWTDEGWPVSAAVPRPRPATWAVRGGEPLVCTADDVMAAADRPATIVVDSRPVVQFLGRAVWFERGAVPADPDGVAHTPRGDLRAGHVPGARSVPWSSLYRSDGTLKSAAELRRVLETAGVPAGTHRAITYCGVGISASALLFALRRAGIPEVFLYDGSWEEWARDSARPVARDA